MLPSRASLLPRRASERDLMRPRTQTSLLKSPKRARSLERTSPVLRLPLQQLWQRGRQRKLLAAALLLALRCPAYQVCTLAAEGQYCHICCGMLPSILSLHALMLADAKHMCSVSTTCLHARCACENCFSCFVVAGAGEAARPVAGASEADAAAASATQAEPALKGTSEAEKLFGAEVTRPPIRQKKVARKSGGGAWQDLPSGAERTLSGLGVIPEEAPPGALPPGAAQPVTQAPAKADEAAAGKGIVTPHQTNVLGPIH